MKFDGERSRSIAGGAPLRYERRILLRLIQYQPHHLGIPHVALRRSAESVNVAAFLDLHEGRIILREMFELLYSHDGAALAAPQVGLSARIVVLDPSGIELGPMVLFNPRITVVGDQTVNGEEGCLSLPGYLGEVERPHALVLHYDDVRGAPRESSLEGWAARIVSHEVDHLDGVLYPDRMAADSELMTAGPRVERRARAALDRAFSPGVGMTSIPRPVSVSEPG